MKTVSRLVLFCGPLVLGGACGDDDFIAPQLIDNIDISMGDCAGLHIDETCQLEVLVRDQDGDVIDDAMIFWSTPDITIATVDFQGRVTGVTEGRATIFAKSTPGPPTDCQLQGVVCDTQDVSVSKPAEPGPEPRL